MKMGMEFNSGGACEQGLLTATEDVCNPGKSPYTGIITSENTDSK